MAGGAGGEVRAGYDRVADEYAARLAGELAHKPFDRGWLDRFADRVRGAGPVADLGCGPGHVAQYLHDRGAAVVGLDLSPAMASAARRQNPALAFVAGDLRRLPLADGSLAGAVAFYSILHLPRAGLAGALGGVRRVLRPGGPLLLAFHVGEGAIHRDEWWGHPVSLDFLLFQPDEVARALGRAGFRVAEAAERDPYPDVEYPSRRAYVLAEAEGPG